jgi:hypothetical protein
VGRVKKLGIFKDGIHEKCSKHKASDTIHEHLATSALLAVGVADVHGAVDS